MFNVMEPNSCTPPVKLALRFATKKNPPRNPNDSSSKVANPGSGSGGSLGKSDCCHPTPLTVVTPLRVLAVKSSANPLCPFCLRDSASEAQRG